MFQSVAIFLKEWWIIGFAIIGHLGTPAEWLQLLKQVEPLGFFPPETLAVVFSNDTTLFLGRYLNGMVDLLIVVGVLYFFLSRIFRSERAVAFAEVQEISG